jgi:hypothetical protein
MAIMDYLRRLLKKKNAVHTRKMQYVHEYHFDEQAPQEQSTLEHRQLLSEVDFSYQGDLEAYVEGLTVPRQVIEHWISAGLLFPEEMKVAERIVRIMRKKEQGQLH